MPRFYAAMRSGPTQVAAALSASGGVARSAVASPAQKEKEKDGKDRFMCVPESHHEPFAKVLVVPTAAPATFALVKYLQARSILFLFIIYYY
jgi:hypothetical protein